MQFGDSFFVLDRQKEIIYNTFMEDNIKEFPYLLICVGKLLVCRNYDFESKIYILHFAYAIHGTHHDLLKKQDGTTGNAEDEFSFFTSSQEISWWAFYYWLCSVNERATEPHKTLQNISQLFPPFLHDNQLTGANTIFWNSFHMLQFYSGRIKKPIYQPHVFPKKITYANY